jgi:hypothetical protein
VIRQKKTVNLALTSLSMFWVVGNLAEKASLVDSFEMPWVGFWGEAHFEGLLLELKFTGPGRSGGLSCTHLVFRSGFVLSGRWLGGTDSSSV